MISRVYAQMIEELSTKQAFKIPEIKAPMRAKKKVVEVSRQKKGASREKANSSIFMARPQGFEPWAYGFVDLQMRFIRKNKECYLCILILLISISYIPFRHIER